MTAMTQTANQTAVVNPPDARAPTGAAQLLRCCSQPLVPRQPDGARGARGGWIMPALDARWHMRGLVEVSSMWSAGMHAGACAQSGAPTWPAAGSRARAFSARVEVGPDGDVPDQYSAVGQELASHSPHRGSERTGASRGHPPHKSCCYCPGLRSVTAAKQRGVNVNDFDAKVECEALT